MQILSMFTKYWEPGFVKTRLASSIGNENAAFLYREFVHQLAYRLDDSADSRVFAVSPDDKVDVFSELEGLTWEATGQGGGDLGDRLQRFFLSALANAQKVVVIGGDCLEVTPALVQRGFDGLEESSAVIGPSGDGGYYMIGLRGPWNDGYARLFDDIAWGTESVLEVTLGRLEEVGIHPVMLEEHSDIDTLDDLKSFRSQSLQIEPNLRAAIDQVLSGQESMGDAD